MLRWLLVLRYRWHRRELCIGMHDVWIACPRTRRVWTVAWTDLVSLATWVQGYLSSMRRLISTRLPVIVGCRMAWCAPCRCVCHGCDTSMSEMVGQGLHIFSRLASFNLSLLVSWGHLLMKRDLVKKSFPHLIEWYHRVTEVVKIIFPTFFTTLLNDIKGIGVIWGGGERIFLLYW